MEQLFKDLIQETFPKWKFCIYTYCKGHILNVEENRPKIVKTDFILVNLLDSKK